MGSQSDLTLDYKPISHRAVEASFGDQSDQTQKLEEFLARLEEERLKIEAFKRELPLCMQLLNNAMEAYRHQLETQQSNQGGGKPVLEEFIPIENMNVDGSEKTPNAPSEKANWMVSAQLWSPAIGATPAKQTAETEHSSLSMSPKLALDTKQRGFLPFSKVDKIKPSNPVLSELALASPEKEVEDSKSSDERRENTCPRKLAAADGQSASQTHRKARRCWSPDLHRRFVNALQILGGSQVATPKQIRELMKVDGLTNDEVKSHLQKYRLHTRRPVQPPQTAAAAPPQLVVLGGIWVPSDYAASAAAGQAIYGAHSTQAHYAAVPQDFYAAPPVPHHHHHHYHHRGNGVVPASYKGRTVSPESDLRSSGESVEEETVERGEEAEEEEGEETEDEEKAMVEVEEGNEGSQVALKF